jgi:hypothetical protein
VVQRLIILQKAHIGNSDFFDPLIINISRCNVKTSTDILRIFTLKTMESKRYSCIYFCNVYSIYIPLFILDKRIYNPFVKDIIIVFKGKNGKCLFIIVTNYVIKLKTYSMCYWFMAESLLVNSPQSSD